MSARVWFTRGHTYGYLQSGGAEIVCRLEGGEWKPEHIRYPFTRERMAYRPLRPCFELSDEAIAHLDRAYVEDEYARA